MTATALRLAKYARYRASAKGRARTFRYNNSMKHRDCCERYRNSHILEIARATTGRDIAAKQAQLAALEAELAEMGVSLTATAEDIAAYIAAGRTKKERAERAAMASPTEPVRRT